LVERLRDTIGRSLGALLLSRRIKADPDRCPELAAILEQWDGEFTPLIRKRVARHIDGCPVCEDERARMVSPAALLGASPIVIPAPAWLRGRTLDRAVLNVPGANARAAGPEDDGSWWPPRDFDGDGLAVPPAAASPGRSGSSRRPARAGLGAALVLVGVGGAALLAAPATFRVVPADSHETLTPTTTTTLVTTTTTTPSIAQRTAPSDTPAMLPPPVLTTTTFVAPTTETTSEPSAPLKTAEPEPSTEAPSTTKLTTTRTKTSQEEPQPLPVIELPPEPPPGPSPEPPPKPPKPTPPNQVPKQPPAKQDPACPVSNPDCDGGGGPVFQ
jgi:hypothetical protein